MRWHTVFLQYSPEERVKYGIESLDEIKSVLVVMMPSVDNGTKGENDFPATPFWGTAKLGLEATQEHNFVESTVENSREDFGNNVKEADPSSLIRIAPIPALRYHDKVAEIR